MSKNKNKPEDTSVLPSFPNRRAVLLHLKEAGFQVSRAKFYRDCEKGTIRVSPDGSVLESEVRVYATGLKRIEGNIEDLSDIQSIKGKKEVEKLEEQIKKLRYEREKDQEKYVLKKEVDLKIISTLTVMDIHFRQLIDMNMTDICRIMGGDIKKMNDAKDFMEQLVDEMMNKIAIADTFSLEYEDI
ncbi:hypothetical protein [Desulfobacula phenolica]|uniref:Uncharacterized protein n=1 Tax=Desulfobacula phenolica TaxID=90732 RepID=A0A1H2I3W7_9BACT|nr:hypothetical protein [Desulfobacula phenolica]SDU38655.1 hypothetical protein SAMN04487931_107213 [Desulfobacula phenolica]